MSRGRDFDEDSDPLRAGDQVQSVGRNALGLRDTPVPLEKIVIDKVVVNPKLEAKLFSKIEVEAVSKSK